MNRRWQIAEGVEYAGFWIRFLAVIIDGVILGIIGFVLFRLMTATAYGSISWLVGAAYSVCFYSLCFWVYWQGQTPGKRILNLRVVRADGAPVDWSTAIIRYIGYTVSGFILLVGFIMAAFDDEKRALHDRLANTRVVMVRRTA